MAQSHVISALVSKRGELAWLLSEAGKFQRSIAKHLAHIDHVLVVVGYRNDPLMIRKRRKNAPQLFKVRDARKAIGR